MSRMCSEIISDKNLNTGLNFILLNWSFCWRLRQELGEDQITHFPTMICVFCYCFLPHLDILWSKITVLDGAGFAVCPQKLKVECVSHHASHGGEFKDTIPQHVIPAQDVVGLFDSHCRNLLMQCLCLCINSKCRCRYGPVECKLSVLFLCCVLATFSMKLLNIKVLKYFLRFVFICSYE